VEDFRVASTTPTIILRTSGGKVAQAVTMLESSGSVCILSDKSGDKRFAVVS
jgi:hypothetical protein